MLLTMFLPDGTMVTRQVRFRTGNMCSGSEEGSYLRLIDFCITQL